MNGDGDIRIGTRERDDALAALEVHHTAGRLDAFEYEDRRGRARDAVTRSDITALFADLPEPQPRFEADPARRNLPAPRPATSHRRLSSTLSALAPFIGIAAFALTRSWLALLLIPAIVIIAKNLDS
ncbi:uncharacterized protein DUF1707 [Humibacillus xanthopallidus]|uniref:Uncharacterized protein DUF1707 n=1 Tax=Humibacillus xanthopallidus TaxID=412689 RepID=A0A543PUC3_9MICO|nr:DUF1707 domain-containing protein [Humibacillus xanthopallidus]TQN47656.1 uncharacterized protein DUF1707 [Humibacillus xanthopallidus]